MGIGTAPTLADWIVAAATIVALLLSAAALWQWAFFRREDQRQRLLDTLVDQLRTLRIQEQRLAMLQMDAEATNVTQIPGLAEPRRVAEAMLANAKTSIDQTENVLRLVLAVRGITFAARLREWRAEVGKTGTMLPQIDIQIDALEAHINAALGSSQK